MGVFLAVAVALLGARARGAVGLDARPRRLFGGPAVGIALDAAGLTVGVLAFVLPVATAIALWRRSRKAKDAAQRVVEVPRVGWATRLSALVITLAAVGGVAGLMVLAARRGGGHAAVEPTRSVTHHHPPAVPDNHSVHYTTSYGMLPTVAVTVLVALTAAAVVIVVLRRRARRPGADGPAARPGPDSVRAGRSAAPGTPMSGPRAEIIGYYADLETYLAARHVARTPAETPEELLDRIGAHGVDTAAARGLAERYLSARYSARAATPEDSAQAARALAEARRRMDAAHTRTASGKSS
ncbi:DUF4129 domain-containing protein [Actinacidiphila alni]|uniref:DUF4129 domain-containing protein n=1 Tax=Actinacidiphila alni TaxID=380248 RepID=UPI000B84152A|nr:DUF4129 domain-containing protein [Actinacidiphila alni]